jgi:hypothetical protein
VNMVSLPFPHGPGRLSKAEPLAIILEHMYT